MKRRFVAVLAAMQLSLTAFSSDPSPDPHTGTYYQEFADPLTWDEARVHANSLSINGTQGHLISISNRSEAKIAKDLGGPAERWIGLTDSTEVSTLDNFDLATLGTSELGNTALGQLPDHGDTPKAGDRGSGFAWVTGEPFTYQNWRSNTPSDFLNRADAVHTDFQGAWLDAPAGETLGQPGLTGPLRKNYVVEFAANALQDRFHLVEAESVSSFFGGRVPNLDVANSVLNLPIGDNRIARRAEGEIYAVSLYDPDLGGGYADYVRGPFLLDEPNVNDQNFAFRINGQIEIPQAGDWTFAYLSGNDAELLIFENQFSGDGTRNVGPARLTQSGQGNLTALPGGSGDTFYFPQPGIYELELTSFDSGFWSYLQLFAAPGKHSEFNTEEFRLVGDIVNGGLAIRDIGDMNDDGKLTLDDINQLTMAVSAATEYQPELDLNADGALNQADRVFWIRELKHSWIGDTNLDGHFNSNDMINVFSTGLYESGQPATWQEGDWNGNHRFDSLDLIMAFQHGGYEAGRSFDHQPKAATVPEPGSGWCFAIFFMVGVLLRRRR